MSKEENNTQTLLDNGQGVIDPDVYFQINKPPSDLPDFEQRLNAFVDYHEKLKTRVVFVTVSYFVLVLVTGLLRK
jgi:phosphopantothenate-cysteine ligase